MVRVLRSAIYFCTNTCATTGCVVLAFSLGALLAVQARADALALMDARPCVEGFRVIGMLRALPDSYVPFAALKRELPWIHNPEVLKSTVGDRLRAWTILHPRDANNVPMPENRTGVEWAKQLLSDLETDKYYGYRDVATRLFTQADRRVMIRKLQEELEAIEQRNYPQRDTVLAVNRVLQFLGKIDPYPDSPEDFIAHLKSKLGFEIKLSTAVQEELSQLYFKAGDTVGLARRAAIENYSNALLTAVQNAPVEKPLTGNILVELRRFQTRFGVKLPEKQDHDLLAFSFDRDPAKFRPLILIPGDISNRALAELILFENDVGGLIKLYGTADNSVASPQRFLSHDTNHIGISRGSRIAQDLLKRSSVEKHLLLASIDSIGDARHRQLAEGALEMALREGLDYAFYPGRNTPALDLQKAWKEMSGELISVAESEWLVVWWRKHLPTGQN